MNKLETQVLIIGAGTTGATIARELSKYKVDVILVEEKEFPGLGETKASHGFIYGGGLTAAGSLVIKSVMLPSKETCYNPNSRKDKMEREAVKEFPELAEELEVSLSHDRRIIVAKSEEDIKKLEVAEEICKQMGCEVRWLDKGGVFDLEPHMTKDIIAGIADDDHQKSVYPWEWAMAMVENAKQNGVKVMFLTKVSSIKPMDGGFVVNTSKGPVHAEFIVNAGGGHADEVAKMAGVCDFGLTCAKSQMLILDRKTDLLNHSVSLAPSPGKSRTLRRTISGNIQTMCSQYYPAEHPDDTATLMDWMDESIAGAQEMIPGISKNDVITSFVGVRVFNTRDPEEDILEISKGNPRFLNAAIRLPGITVTPAAARLIVDLLGNQGLEITEKPDFNPHRSGIPKVRDLSIEEKNRLISRDSSYGRIVCRCEGVTEGEIVGAIKRGASTIQTIQFSTRAGMGRCQRDFCGMHMVEILARELGIPEGEVTFKGPGSEISYKAK
jgi:glycerol-3-phosphate dehydrogenase